MEGNIYDEIIKDFNKLQGYLDKIEEEKRNNFDPYEMNSASVIEIEEYYDFDIKMLEYNIEENFNKLYDFSLKNDFYYFDSPAKVYINHFESRKENFFKSNIDANELDFLSDEIEYFSSKKENRLIGKNPAYNYDKYISDVKKYKFSFKRKLDYISEKLKKFGLKIEMSEPESVYDSMYNIETFMEPSLVLVPFENKDIEIKNEKNQIENEISNSNKKLDTDISVPQLSLLFKMINDLKPPIFNIATKEELFAFISDNFKTKKSSEKGISTNKLRNEFSTPDLKAIEFWEKHLHTMLAQLRNLK